MRTVAKLRLYVSREDEWKLLSTMERYNAACNYVSPTAFSLKEFSSIGLQKYLYHDIKQRFGLSSQQTILAIRKVANSYRATVEAILERNKIHKALDEPLEALEVLCFREHGGITYDSRVLSIGRNVMSILTIAGRIKLHYMKPEYFSLRNPKEADLLYQNGKFHLHVTIDTAEEPMVKSCSYLGVDLGVVNIATTSDGKIYNSEATENTRKRYGRLRGVLQKKNTKDAKAKLKEISGKERRFKSNVNHIISNEIVSCAKGTKRGIALEDLKGILRRTTVRHEQRERHHKWAFQELRKFLAYKARIAGVALKIVDASYTSQECPECGYTSRKNRKSQSEFFCEKCSYSEHADVKAARIIAARVAVSQPIAVCSSKGERLNRKPVKSVAEKATPTTLVEGS